MTPDEIERSEGELTKTPAIHNPLRPDVAEANADPHVPTNDPTIVPTKPCTEEDATCAVPRRESSRPGGTVHRDGTGKTIEGHTGVSGETDERNDAAGA